MDFRLYHNKKGKLERCAGVHKRIDFMGVEPSILRSATRLGAVVQAAALVAGAHIVYRYTYQRNMEDADVSGVVLLEKGHITYHSWADKKYILLDVFLAGDTDIYTCTASLKEALRPKKSKVQESLRGTDVEVDDPDLFNDIASSKAA